MITVSDEMIEAGVEFWHAKWGALLLDDFVREIYLAMHSAITNAEATGDDVVRIEGALRAAIEEQGLRFVNDPNGLCFIGGAIDLTPIARTIATLSPNGVSQSAVERDCPSCGGLNISCPEGCGRDPETGELDGSTLTTQPASDTGLREAAKRLLDRIDKISVGGRPLRNMDMELGLSAKRLRAALASTSDEGGERL